MTFSCRIGCVKSIFLSRNPIACPVVTPDILDVGYGRAVKYIYRRRTIPSPYGKGVAFAQRVTTERVTSGEKSIAFLGVGREAVSLLAQPVMRRARVTLAPIDLIILAVFIVSRRFVCRSNFSWIGRRSVSFSFYG